VTLRAKGREHLHRKGVFKIGERRPVDATLGEGSHFGRHN